MSGILTDDEYAILMIAAEGRSMLPIGRWEKPVNDLVARGLMIRHDPSNNTISPAGREALEQRERDDIAAIRAVGQKLAGAQAAQTSIRELAEQAAQLLAQAARASAEVTGDHPEVAVRKWIDEIYVRAIQLVGQ